MSVLETVKLILEYGVMTVICAVFIIMAIILFKVFIDKFTDKGRKRTHDAGISKRFEVDEEVQSLLNKFQEDHNCERVHIVEFSNSVTSVAYLPFRYMNCTYEVHDFSVPYTAKFIDKLSTSLFTPFFMRLKKDPILALDVENPDKSLGGAVYDVMQNSGERFGLFTLILNRNRPIGYVAMRSSKCFTQSDKQDLFNLSAKLSVLLGVMDK